MTPSCISNVLQNQFQRDFRALCFLLSCLIQKNRIAVHLQQRLSSKIIVDVKEIIKLSERSEID
jgi:hypothetical protein